MPKIPDVSKLTEKFDFQNLVNSVKSIINPGSQIPENLAGDPIAAKLTLISQGLQQLSQTHAEQEQQIARITNLVTSLYQDISAAKLQKESGGVTGATSSTATGTTSGTTPGGKKPSDTEL